MGHRCVVDLGLPVGVLTSKFVINSFCKHAVGFSSKIKIFCDFYFGCFYFVIFSNKINSLKPWFYLKSKPVGSLLKPCISLATSSKFNVFGMFAASLNRR